MTNDESLNNLVNEAFLKWAEITGVKKKESYNAVAPEGGFSEWDLIESIDELNESRTLDETGLTTWMMLRGLAEQYMKSQTYSAYDIVFDSKRVKDRLDAMIGLHTILENSLVIELIDEFTTKIRATAEGRKFKDTKGLEELLADKHDLALIRRDALRSMERFHVHQFTQGNSDKMPIGMNGNIYEIWNVNSLVRALQAQRIPGITTVLVRDPMVMHSFFVLAVKNGDNITILTDKDEEAHPAQKRMTRKPSRHLERRADQHWFPYELLDLEVSEHGRNLYANARTAVVPINIEAVRLSGVEDLSPNSFVWLMLVCDCVRDKFWKQNFHVPELSYTGEMVQEPHTLVGANSSLVRSGLYTPLVLEPLTPADVTSEATKAQWRRSPTYFNEWMEQRYGDKVPENVFNVVGESGLLLVQSSKEIEPLYKDLTRHLEALDPQNFGTREKMEQDRQWAARMNKMTIIQRLAEKEKDATKTELIEWYKTKIHERRDFFAEAATRGTLIGPAAHIVREKTEDGKERVFGDEEIGIHDDHELIYAQMTSRNYAGKSDYDHIWMNEQSGDISLCDYMDNRRDDRKCFDRPELKATVFTLFAPRSPQSLAFFLGMKVEDLPWQLKNWFHRDLEPYHGNSILDRCDPIDWVLKNPWVDFRWRVGIAFSKSAFNARRKALGLERVDPPKPTPRDRNY